MENKRETKNIILVEENPSNIIEKHNQKEEIKR